MGGTANRCLRESMEERLDADLQRLSAKDPQSGQPQAGSLHVPGNWTAAQAPAQDQPEPQQCTALHLEVTHFDAKIVGHRLSGGNKGTVLYDVRCVCDTPQPVHSAGQSRCSSSWNVDRPYHVFIELYDHLHSLQVDRLPDRPPRKHVFHSSNSRKVCWHGYRKTVQRCVGRCSMND